MQERAERLHALLDRHLPPRAKAWQERAFRAARAGAEGTAEGPRTAFVNELAAAARWLGKDEVALLDDERRDLGEVGVALPAGLALDELGRMAMLAALAVQLPGDGLEAVVDDCYRHGDSRERRAVLRALPLLPRPERFVAIAADACRTHALPVFEAVACENPYPAAHFPDASFHQMVLKALFLGVALDRIVGLQARSSPELQRMASAYASERRAAGRSVPADIGLVLGGERGPDEAGGEASATEI